MAVRITLGSGKTRTSFDRAPLHSAKWIEQKKGFRQYLGMPAHGKVIS